MSHQVGRPAGRLARFQVKLRRGETRVGYTADKRGGPTDAPTAWYRPGRLIGGLTLSPLLALLSGPLSAAAPVDVNQIITTACAACHTQTGNSVVTQFPKLAGQAPDYLAKQLTDVKSGVRKSEVMSPIATKLSNAEIKALASYFAGQARTPGVVGNSKLVAAGAVVYNEGNKENGVPACAGCHMPDGRGAPRFPLVASQHADYVVAQLKAFKAGTRSNDLGKIMRAVASRMTDDEMTSVAQYIASLPVPTASR